MKYTKYGTFLGGILTIAILMGYSFFHELEDKVFLPYVFIGMLIYFFLVGYYIGNKTCSFKEGMKAGLIAGGVTMIFIGVAFFYAHTVLYYYDAISEPQYLAKFKTSGLLSMRRFMAYESIRGGVIGFICGTAFATFAASAGSFTASHIRRPVSCDIVGKGV